MAATNAKIVPQPFFLLRSTAVLWVYPFWHTYGLIHETLPMAALVALKVVLTGCALLGQLRLWAGQGIFRTGRPWAAAVGLGLSENRSARRSVDPERDRDEQVYGDDYFPVEE